MLTMLAFCVGVLLIACVNVVNMQFARATLRARELAVRSSLGARRVRIIRQMLTESLLLAGFGALVGIGLAYLSVDWLSATIHNLENRPPAWMVFEIDGRVLAFTVAATLVAAVVSGLLPAWMAARSNVADVLREGGRGSTSRPINLALRLVLKQGSRQLALGLGLGVPLAFGLAMALHEAISNILYGVTARDPFAYLTVVALITVAALVAMLVPARRATRVDPMIALRAE